MISIGTRVKLKQSVFNDKTYEPLQEKQILAIGFSPRNNVPCTNSMCEAPLGVNAVGLVELGKSHSIFLVSICRECDSVFGNSVFSQ